MSSICVSGMPSELLLMNHLRSSRSSGRSAEARFSKMLQTSLFFAICLLLSRTRRASSFVLSNPSVSLGNSRLSGRISYRTLDRLPLWSSTCLSSTTSSSQTVTLPHVDFGTTSSSTSPSSSPPVIFLHGLLGSKRNFASIGSSLAKQLAPSQQRRILGIDLRNHGDTTQHCASMDYTDMAHDVLEFLNDQDIASAVLVGHSMGGKVAQACALLDPSRVDGLVVLDIAPVPYSHETDMHWKAVHDILQSMHAINVGPGITKAMVDQQLRTAVPDPAVRAFVLTNLRVSKTDGCQWTIPIDTIVHQLDQLAAFDIPSSSHQYHGDVFFIHGGQSRFVKSSYLPQIAAYFPNHLLTTIRGAGHWIHAEAPDDTTALLKRYLER